MVDATESSEVELSIEELERFINNGGLSGHGFDDDEIVRPAGLNSGEIEVTAYLIYCGAKCQVTFRHTGQIVIPVSARWEIPIDGGVRAQREWSIQVLSPESRRLRPYIEGVAKRALGLWFQIQAKQMIPLD